MVTTHICRKTTDQKREDGHFDTTGKNKSRMNRLRIRLTLLCLQQVRDNLRECYPVCSIPYLAAKKQEDRQAYRRGTGKSYVTVEKGYRTSQDTLGVQYFNFVVEDDAQ